VLALLLPARQTWVEVRAREDALQLAKEAVTDYQLALRSVLLPLTDIFDRIITAPDEAERLEAKGAAKQAVVNYVVQFTNIPRTRSCYFEYQCNNGEKKLVCPVYSGRDSKPRTTQENSLRFPAERRYNYKEYISVSVATSREIFGLLTLDALGGDELREQNQKEMLLLGIALAHKA
jgi:hypothetical protein